MLVAAAFGGVFVTCQAFETAEGDVKIGPEADLCNGSADLCDRRLDQVVFLGTHNSMSAASEPGWYFVEHYTGITAQLDAGVRALFLDTWYGYDTGDGVASVERDFVLSKLPPDRYSAEVREAARRLIRAQDPPEDQAPGTYLCHAYCELGATPFAPMLRNINVFLEQNPGEVILLFIQDQVTPEDTAKAFISSGLVKRVYYHVPGEPLPTLREMIERDERVVVLAENVNSGVDWYLHARDLVQETPFLAPTPADFRCEAGRGSPQNPIFVLNHWLSTSPPSPIDAEAVNAFDFLHARVAECERERGRTANVIVVNFSEVGDAKLVVDVLNGVAEPPGAPENGTG
jgi:hypothetical protein